MSSTIQLGSHAPATDLTLPTADGDKRSIGEALARGPVLLGIYKSSCAASKAMLPMLERIHDRFGDEGLTVFGVAQDSANITRSFARRYGVTFPLLIEGGDYPLSRA